MPIPVRIPISSGNARQATNAPMPGIKSVSKIKQIYYLHKFNLILLIFILLLRHIGLMTLISTIKITAAIITAASVAFGIKANNGVKKSKANTTSKPKRTYNVDGQCLEY